MGAKVATDDIKKYNIAVIGLGYVGLQLVCAFARAGFNVKGLDLDGSKVSSFREGIDRNFSVDPSDLKRENIYFTSDRDDIRGANFYIVAVPTPVDSVNSPDLSDLAGASQTVGAVITKGSVVCYESTVYPGVTEDFCLPIIESVSGLKCGVDFKIGYSPERINPGDRVHTLENIIKVVSGCDEEALDIIDRVYGSIVRAGTYRAASIRTAEAAKVIENTQRDLNIALMNELAIIFDRINLNTKDVLDAAATKWNFVNFTPGLVGGHCIGVDPYYLTYKAIESGYTPTVVLAGRTINDYMGKFIAAKTMKLLSKRDVPSRGRVGILGVTFKENVPDLRNSRVPDIVEELKEYGITPLVTDPLVTSEECMREYGFGFNSLDEFHDLDAIIIAVPHDEYINVGWNYHVRSLRCRCGIVIDVKAAFYDNRFDERVIYWSL